MVDDPFFPFVSEMVEDLLFDPVVPAIVFKIAGSPVCLMDNDLVLCRQKEHMIGQCSPGKGKTLF